MAKRRRPPRPDPVTARPPRVLLFVAAGVFAVLAAVAIATAVVVGQLLLIINGLIPALVSALFIAVATRQSISLDRTGVRVKGFGSAGRTVSWSDFERLELTDAGRFRMSPRLVLSSGRGLPMPAAWRVEGGRRLPEAALDWSRWARLDVVGERVTGRRWPLIALVGAGGLLGLLVAAARLAIT